MSPLDLSAVKPGFADPVHQSQAVFRQVMQAMSRPGTRARLDLDVKPPEGLDAAAAAFALTFLDIDTPVWLSPALAGGETETFIRFHCGCPVTQSPASAAFAFAGRDTASAPLSAFNPGSEKYPDQSTTLVLACSAFDGGPQLVLEGPGIKLVAVISPVGLPATFIEDWRQNQARFQCGVDLVLTCGSEAICLPRSIRIELKGA